MSETVVRCSGCPLAECDGGELLGTTYYCEKGYFFAAGEEAQGEASELTPEQLKQQDAVDNAILHIFEILAEGTGLENDGSLRAKVRDVIFSEIVEPLGISEMTFYPYLTDQPA